MSKLTYSEEIPGYRLDVFSGKPNFEVVHVKQVHGAITLEDKNIETEAIEADGIFTTTSSIPLAIKTADCLPIAVIGNKGAALLHAGWRGVHQKIVLSSCLKDIEPTFFYIGPFIQAHHFEVQEDFKKNFPDSQHFSKSGANLHFDLGAEVSDQIKQNYPQAKIQICSISTYDDPRFHSYRQNATSERNWNVLSRTS